MYVLKEDFKGISDSEVIVKKSEIRCSISWLAMRQYHLGAFRAAESQAYPRPTESESAL